jgi:hypothetical protein
MPNALNKRVGVVYKYVKIFGWRSIICQTKIFLSDCPFAEKKKKKKKKEIIQLYYVHTYIYTYIYDV